MNVALTGRSEFRRFARSGRGHVEGSQVVVSEFPPLRTTTVGPRLGGRVPLLLDPTGIRLPFGSGLRAGAGLGSCGGSEGEHWNV